MPDDRALGTGSQLPLKSPFNSYASGLRGSGSLGDPGLGRVVGPRAGWCELMRTSGLPMNWRFVVKMRGLPELILDLGSAIPMLARNRLLGNYSREVGQCLRMLFFHLAV